MADSKGLNPDPFPCSGKLIRHHVRYKSEGGNGELNNSVPLCEGHQMFCHSKTVWGKEEEFDIDDLIKECTEKTEEFLKDVSRFRKI